MLILSVFRAIPSLRRYPVRRVLYKQVYFSGLESLPLIVLVGGALGGIIVGQLHFSFGQSGEGALKLLSLILLGELAPMLTAIIMIARSSSAMASELAAMKVNGEIRNLVRMSIDPIRYLVMPRVVGMLLSSLVLTIYMASTAIVIGAIIVAGKNAPSALILLAGNASLPLISSALLKSLFFGVGVAFVSCWKGLAAGSDFTDIPKAASSAVIRSLIVVFVLDGLFIAFKVLV